MGIDVYLSWDEMSEEEEKARYTGFSVHSGDVGYLREAYHGEPYATEALFQEPWDEQPEDGMVIPNKVLKARLPMTLEACERRMRTIYKEEDSEEIERCKKAYTDFVELHGRMEKAGKHPKVMVSY